MTGVPDPPTPPENPKNLKANQVSIQFWAIIGMPVKGHLNCWQADNGPLKVVFGLSHQLKKTEKKCCKGWTPSGKTFWIHACESTLKNGSIPKDAIGKRDNICSLIYQGGYLFSLVL